MAAQAFRIGVHRTEDLSQVLVRCHGPFVAGDGADVRVWFDLLHRPERSELLLDLSAVTRMDAAGVGLLAELQRTWHLHGGSVRVTAAPERVRTLLRVTGLSETLDKAPAPAFQPARVPPFRAGTLLPLLSNWCCPRSLAVV